MDQTVSVRENSTYPKVLTSGFGCRTSGHFKMYFLCWSYSMMCRFFNFWECLCPEGIFVPGYPVTYNWHFATHSSQSNISVEKIYHYKTTSVWELYNLTVNKFWNKTYWFNTNVCVKRDWTCVELTQNTVLQHDS